MEDRLEPLETRAVWEGGLEIRRDGRTISGFFPYSKLAVVSDRGKTRKETFKPRAFRFAVEDPTREINLLNAHNFNQPLASKISGAFDLVDDDTGIAFTALLPPVERQPTWMKDTILAIQEGLARGVSPGFRVPPGNVVRAAEQLVPEPGNPGVFIREINEAVLYEMSVVTRPAYTETTIDVRSEEGLITPDRRLHAYRWI